MKKSMIILAALLLIPMFATAQRYIPRSNNVSVSSTHITKTKKALHRYDAKVGFQHFIEVSPSFDFDAQFYGMTGINYIGGYRLNNWFFVGAGAGVNFSHDVNKGLRKYVGSSTVIYETGADPESAISANRVHGTISMGRYDGQLTSVSIPLYVNLRGYYMRTRWSPYSSLSFGGILASKESGTYLDFSTGVDFRLSKDPSKDSKHLYVALGFWFRYGVRCERNDYIYSGQRLELKASYESGEDCMSVDCPHTGSIFGHYHYVVSDLFYKKDDITGLSVHVGLSF